MARPKKYNNGSKVISYRIPLAAERHIRGTVEKALTDWNKPVVKDLNIHALSIKTSVN